MKPTSSLPKHVQKIVLSGGVPKICTLCDGTRGRDEGMGWFTCPHCEGTGYEPESSDETPTPQASLAPFAKVVWTKLEDDNPKRICYVCACYAQRTDEEYGYRERVAYVLQFIYAIDGEPDCFDANVFVCCDCFKTLSVPQTSSSSSRSQVRREKEELEWIRTADRPPTKEDALNENEEVYCLDRAGNYGTNSWRDVRGRKEIWPFWSPIPKLPDVTPDAEEAITRGD